VRGGAVKQARTIKSSVSLNWKHKNDRRIVVSQPRQTSVSSLVCKPALGLDEMANPLIAGLAVRSIWGGRFFRRRFSSWLDPLSRQLFRPFLKVCLDQYHRDLSLFVPNACGAAAEIRPGSRYISKIDGCG